MKTGKLSVTLSISLNCFRVCTSVMDFSNCTLAEDLLCQYDACFWAVHHRACCPACVCVQSIALGVNEVLGQATLHSLLAVRLILHF